jgi:hypothetical protein
MLKVSVGPKSNGSNPAAAMCARVAGLGAAAYATETQPRKPHCLRGISVRARDQDHHNSEGASAPKIGARPLCGLLDAAGAHR